MENNIINPIILDFFGMPGSGKSTVARELHQKLSQCGYNVKNLSYCIDNSCVIKRLCIKFLYSLVYTLCHPFFVRKLTRIISINDMGGFKEAVKQLVNITYKMYFLNNLEGYDYIILDEGICQMIVSALYYSNEDITIYPLLEYLLNHVSKSIVFVYLSVDEKIVFNRLENRMNENSRIEKERDKGIMQKRLDTINRRCNIIKKYVNAIVIDARNKPQESARFLYNHIIGNNPKVN